MFVYVKKILLFCSVKHSVTYKVTAPFLGGFYQISGKYIRNYLPVHLVYFISFIRF